MLTVIPFLSWFSKPKIEIEAASLKEAVENSGANLRGANLRDADLCGANLCGADLRGVNLYGANDEKITSLLKDGLVYFSLGPIGSRSDILQGFNTDKGLFIQTGCFGPKSADEFLAAVKETHGKNDHGKAYIAAIALMRFVMKVV